MKLKDKVAFITGASSGIGYEVARLMAKEGCNLIITYNSNYVKISELEKQLTDEYNVKVLTLRLDMSNEEEIEEAFCKAIDYFKKIDILINNAGISIDTEFDSKTKDNFMKILDVNLVGPFLLSRLIGNLMYKNKYGKIVNVSSTNAVDTYYPESLDYDASKAGLISLTHNLALHYKPYVNVNAVLPGWTNTPMNINLDKDFVDEENKKIYLGRFASSEEIAKVIVFLALDDASYVNNSVIRVDGGYNG